MFTSQPTAIDYTCQPVPDLPGFTPTVEALAEAMRVNYQHCTEDLLQSLGFPVSFQKANRDAAVALANRGFVQQVEGDGEDEETTVARMRTVVGEIMPTLGNILTGLRYHGFSERQINLYTRRVINLASRDFVAIATPKRVQS